VGVSKQSFLVDNKGRAGAFCLRGSLPGLESVPLYLCNLHTAHAVGLNAHKVVASAVADAGIAAQTTATLDDSDAKNEKECTSHLSPKK